MKRFLHTMAEAGALLYCLTMLMVIYATGAVAMYNTPVPSWYSAAFAIVVFVPAVVGVFCAGKAITRAIIRARKPKRLGVIPSNVIVRALCVTK